jgi:hypothetical protein
MFVLLLETLPLTPLPLPCISDAGRIAGESPFVYMKIFITAIAK